MAQLAIQKSSSGGDTSLQVQTRDAGQGKLPQLRSVVEVDRKKPLPTSLQSDFIPDDVLFALTQPPIARDKLGPPAISRSLAVSQKPTRPPATGVWHHKRREKFKHLIDVTACNCGAGRDISFLYDVHQEYSHPEKPDTLDSSSVRKDNEVAQKRPLHLPDTLIPEEYHMVKNRGVMGIEYHEDKYTINPDDHEKHLVVFPSMKPTSRYEVLQLRKTMDNMLEKVGFNDVEADDQGPTQMHNLLELIKKEQNIYNIIFHELIRQTSVECADRGQLLADLRLKYSQLLNRVPSQIMGLYEEVMAQRALDRRLTDELLRFKNTISYLTSQLTEVKDHDKIVTKEAQKTQEELRQALAEAKKNSALLSEYHDLYELQRMRLERQVIVLSEEKEIWSTAAYSLAMKVTEEYKLTTAKRLHVSEKAWVKMANHFTILLSDRDTDLLTKIQGHVEKWRDKIDDFHISLRRREDEMSNNLKGMRTKVLKLAEDFFSFCFNEQGNMVTKPDQLQMAVIKDALMDWDKILTKEVETFSGDLLLSNLDELTGIHKEVDGWADNAMTVFGRHRTSSGSVHPEQLAMIELNEEIYRLLHQFQLRVTGENGIVAIAIQLLNVIESWCSRINNALYGTSIISESDWAIFFHSLKDWVVTIDQAEVYVGSTQTEEARQEGLPHVSIDIHDVVRKTQKWATTTSNAIDSEDAKLVDQVASFHSSMVNWMVQALLHLAPNRKDNSKEAAEMMLMGNVSVPQLLENSKQLFESLHTFSEYVTLCCDGLLTGKAKDLEAEEKKVDNELRDLQKLRGECENWIHAAEILMSSLTGVSVESLFPARVRPHVPENVQPVLMNSSSITSSSETEKSKADLSASSLSTGNLASAKDSVSGRG